MKYHHYLKLFFTFLFIQNISIVASDSISVSSALNPTDSSLVNGLLSDKNATDSIGLNNYLFNNTNSSIDLNSTLFNNATLLNNTTPVLLNCTDAINNNSTDLSKCTPLNITTSFECTKVNYDFLLASINWQPKNCYSRNCDVPYETPKWRISGLRGSFMNGTRPAQCCSDRQLKLDEINSLLPELRDNWIFEKDSNVTDSLVEEWNLHGSCVKEYEGKSNWELFAKILSLNKKFPIEQWLSNARIEPNNDKKYGFQFFNNTLTSNVNKRIQIRCKTVDYEKRISIIDSVNFCLDKISTDVIDCPANFESNCLEMVYYNTHLIDYKVNDDILYRDMNYYSYRNYHSSYSPFMTGHYRSSSSLSPFATGALAGAALVALPATALAVPATYQYFKNKNKYNKMKYGGLGGNAMPWYASSAFSNTFAPTPNFNSYGSKYNNLPGGNNLYPRQNNYFAPPPPSVWSGVQGNKNFGNLNTPDYSPNFYNKNSYPSYPSGNYPSGSYPSYPKYPSNGNYPNYPPPSYSSNPSYPSYPSGKSSGYPNSNPSYPSYPKSSNLPPQPPAYSDINKNSNGYYPKEAPKYSEIDKSKPSYPVSNKPSAPSLSELDKGKSGSSGLYPKIPNDLNGKHSPSAPSFADINDKSKPSYPSSNSKPSYPPYSSSSSNSKPYPVQGSSSSNSKPYPVQGSSSSSSSSSKSKSGGFFGNLFNKISGRSSSSSNSGSRSGGSRSGGSRSGGSYGGSRSMGGGRSRG